MTPQYFDLPPASRITPPYITRLRLNEVFVYGSNLAGRNGKGAALWAKTQFGAADGIGEGLSGCCYAIPTKDEHLQVLPLADIDAAIGRFVAHARRATLWDFSVTAIGTGLAGYTAAQIAPLFFRHGSLPANVSLPEEFWGYRIDGAHLHQHASNHESAIKYLSVCSGIEAASAAWHDLGWVPVAFSEIESFPSAVLKHRFPHVPNMGDMTKFKQWKLNEPIDILVGGTPCQAFSVAGLRKGLADPRGNLTLTFLAMVEHFRPGWVVWENVPGVLSESTGAFGAFLGGLAELGYGWAYRVLDAQYFGVAQRRRRVFVVASAGGWQRAAAVLFEPESLRWDSTPSREAGEGIAPTISARTSGGGGLGTDFNCDGGLIAHTLKADGFDASEDGTGRGVPLWPCSIAPTLNAHFGDKQGLEDQHALNGGGCSFPPPISQCLNAGAMGRSDAETETLIPCMKNQ